MRVFATSAAREALNADELITAIRDVCGLRTAIISGDEEASLAFEGATTDARFAAASLVLTDVGGGSTQFILGRDGRKHFAQSFPLGAVRLLEKMRPSDPPQPGNWKHAAREWQN